MGSAAHKVGWRAPRARSKLRSSNEAQRQRVKVAAWRGIKQLIERAGVATLARQLRA
jgi:hypothetical protein